jgi:hypothetical protein
MGDPGNSKTQKFLIRMADEEVVENCYFDEKIMVLQSKLKGDATDVMITIYELREKRYYF